MRDVTSVIHRIADWDRLRRAMFMDSAAQLLHWPRWLRNRLGTGCGNRDASNMDVLDGRLPVLPSSRRMAWEDQAGLASRAC